MKKKIGIIGGAGPMASCLLYQEIIRICQQEYNCRNDNDFPEIIVLNYPFSPMISVHDVTTNKAKLIKELQACFDRLAQQDVQIAIIACNTLHTLLDSITTIIPECMRVDETVFEYIKNNNLKTVAVFGTETTMRLGLYQRNDQVCSVVPIPSQQIITSTIEHILTGIITDQEMSCFRNMVGDLYKANPFDGIVLGCTELSLLYDQLMPLAQQLQIQILDTTRLVASMVVQKSFEDV